MKHFFAVLFFAAPLFLHGQEIKINVIFKNEPLPYTYISVNKTPVAITNASGIASIPVSKISLGDTITSSMIGMLPVSVIYDQRIQQNLSCELVHTTEDVYNLSEVMAIGYSNKSSKKIFNKVVKTYQTLIQNGIVSAKFTSLITLPNGSTYSVNGSFVLENNMPKRFSESPMFYYFNTPPKIETINDTTNLSRELQESIRYIYRQACGTIGQLYKEQKSQQTYTNMNYLGLKEVLHFFSYSCFYPNDFAVLQILFETDADSKELTNAKYTTLSLRDDSDSNHTITLSCQKLSNVPKAPFGKGKVTITVPKDIEAKRIKPDGTVIDLKIYDASIKFQE